MEKPETPGALDTDDIVVRTMREADLDAIVAIDAAFSGRRRPEYFGRMMERALRDSALQISLVAEAEERVAGFVVGSVFYGEFGVAEPSATLDAIGVEPTMRRHRVGRAMLRQLRLNLGALRVTHIRTEVELDELELISFFRKEGFRISSRICLEVEIDPTAPGD